MENLIRHRILRGLIWVCTVGLCPTKGTLGLYGLRYDWPDVQVVSDWSDTDQKAGWSEQISRSNFLMIGNVAQMQQLIISTNIIINTSYMSNKKIPLCTCNQLNKILKVMILRLRQIHMLKTINHPFYLFFNKKIFSIVQWNLPTLLAEYATVIYNYKISIKVLAKQSNIVLSKYKMHVYALSSIAGTIRMRDLFNWHNLYHTNNNLKWLNCSPLKL